MKQRKSRVRPRPTLPRALVIEPNPSYRSVISHVVEIAGGQTESVAQLEQGWKQFSQTKGFDVVIVGTSAEHPLTPHDAGRVRTASNSPLIVLAEGYDETRDTLEIFEAGANQVLPKPFVPDALVGAIKSEIRKSGPVSVVPLATRIELARLVFDAQRRQVSSDDRTITLTKREWQLLSFFLASPNQFFSAADVVLQAWGSDGSVEQFRSYVTRLRRKLAPFAAICRLTSEKGKGYSLVIEEAAVRAT